MDLKPVDPGVLSNNCPYKNEKKKKTLHLFPQNNSSLESPKCIMFKKKILWLKSRAYTQHINKIYETSIKNITQVRNTEHHKCPRTSGASIKSINKKWEEYETCGNLPRAGCLRDKYSFIDNNIL